MLNADASDPSVRELVNQRSAGAGADDVVVTVPVASVMASAAQLMSADGMLVFFAGVANGTTGPLDMSRVYLNSAQYTGTSGSTLEDQALVLDKTAQGSLSPDLNLAAVGGIEAGRDGVQAMLDGRLAHDSRINSAVVHLHQQAPRPHGQLCGRRRGPRPFRALHYARRLLR